MDVATQDRLRSSLQGLVCTSLDFEHELLNMRIGPRLLTVLGAWRVVHGDQLQVGSGSGLVSEATLRELLVGSSVHSTSVRGPFHDLTIAFSNGAILEVFADSESFENWQLVSGPDDMVIAGPGPLWSTF